MGCRGRAGTELPGGPPAQLPSSWLSAGVAEEHSHSRACWAAGPVESPVLCPLPRSSRGEAVTGSGPCHPPAAGRPAGLLAASARALVGLCPQGGQASLREAFSLRARTGFLNALQSWPFTFALLRSLCPPALHGGDGTARPVLQDSRVQTVLSGTTASPGWLRRAGGPGEGHTSPPRCPREHPPAAPSHPSRSTAGGRGVPWSGPLSSLHLPLHSACGPPPVRP